MAFFSPVYRSQFWKPDDWWFFKLILIVFIHTCKIKVKNPYDFLVWDGKTKSTLCHVLTNNGWPVIYIFSCLDSRGCMFLVQSPSLFIFHHMALLMMQSLINHNTISWANQLNTNSTYQTTGSFAEFNCKIHWNFHSAHYTHYIHSLQNKS